MKTPGKIVETHTGEIGRTYNSKGLIKGKVPVYLCIEKKELKLMGLKGPTICTKYSEKGVLYDKSKLKIIGYID